MLLRSTGGSRKTNIGGIRSFVDEQNLPAAVTSQVGGGAHFRRAQCAFDYSIAGTVVFLKHLEYAVTRVRLAGLPVQQGDRGKLGWVSEQLGRTKHVDSLFGESGIEICKHSTA
jgi:hypothetical protein